MLCLLVLGLAVGQVMADYSCLCSYGPQKPVYSSAASTSQSLGNLNEDDCKQVVNITGLDTNKWTAIAFQHQIGYISMDDETEIVPCQGNPPVGDALTTTTGPGGGGQVTTVKQTLMPSSSAQPVTMESTANPPSKSSTHSTMSLSNSNTMASSTIGAYSSIGPSSGTTQTPSGTSGNTALCPSTVRLYAQQDNEILVENGGSCFTVVPHRVSWTHAESICNHRGGHLFHISSATENAFMYNLLDTRFNHSVWMGLHDIGHEEHFTWTSGDAVTYTNWYPNRKSNFYSHNVEDCTVFVPFLNNGQWDDIPCGSSSIIIESLQETHYFVCQFATVSPQPGQISSGNINLCPASLQYLAQRGQNTLAQYGNSCYEWVNQRSSWTHAESNCRHHGGHLLQINDAQEEAFIQKFMTSHDSQHAIWIGLYDIGHEETFKWTSGETVTYTNWVPGRKDNFYTHSVEDCVVLIPYKQGQWDDISCGSSSSFFGDRGETHPYMCEYKINSGTNPGGIIVG